MRITTANGDAAPDAGGQVIVDIDGVLVLAHSEKPDAAATRKKTFGHHPLTGFVDHGRGGSGEPVVGLLRPSNPGSNTAADHIESTSCPWPSYRSGPGGTHEFVAACPMTRVGDGTARLVPDGVPAAGRAPPGSAVMPGAGARAE